MRLAVGIRPDPLGDLQRSPNPPAAIGGVVLLLKGRERKGEGIGERSERECGKQRWNWVTFCDPVTRDSSDPETQLTR